LDKSGVRNLKSFVSYPLGLERGGPAVAAVLPASFPGYAGGGGVFVEMKSGPGGLYDPIIGFQACRLDPEFYQRTIGPAHLPEKSEWVAVLDRDSAGPNRRRT
jgi:hypothetical protein